MSSTWTTEECPHCHAQNWLNHGDSSDCTVPDIEACKCWKCEKKFFLDPEEIKWMYCHEVREWDKLLCDNEEDEYEYQTGDDFLEQGAFTEWGRKNPAEPYRLIA